MLASFSSTRRFIQNNDPLNIEARPITAGESTQVERAVENAKVDNVHCPSPPAGNILQNVVFLLTLFLFRFVNLYPKSKQKLRTQSQEKMRIRIQS